jgi:hypothetical protein
MRPLGQRLIDEERRVGGEDSGAESRAALRVCEKLRHPLSTYAGVAGFRSLLKRAHGLASSEVRWLEAIEIQADGSFRYSAETEAQLASEDAGRATGALVSQLIGLLDTFIGEALTLRLVHEVWPNVALKESKSAGK